VAAAALSCRAGILRAIASSCTLVTKISIGNPPMVRFHSFQHTLPDFFAVEICGDERTFQCDLVEPLSDTLELVQNEYDHLVQKVESDFKLRQVQKEAALLMHSWPEEWFLKSKRVPKNPLDPETEEVCLCQTIFSFAHCV
jgi:hypothetical protein